MSFMNTERKHLFDVSNNKLVVICVVLFVILVAGGLTIYLVANQSQKSEDSEPVSAEDRESVAVTETGDTNGPEVVSTGHDESTVDDGQSDQEVGVTEVTDTLSELDDLVPKYFEALYMNPESVTYLMSGEGLADEASIPAFHQVSIIQAEAGTNPKTNKSADTLMVVMDALPDRYMNVAVVVATDTPQFTGMTPDAIQGIQWTFSYQNGEFYKTARAVSETGEITELDAEHFNIRLIGLEDSAEVEFFGPPGTIYYGILIYDDTYFTWIEP